MIRQGDQFPLSFTIRNNGTAVTPENSADVKVKINSKVYKYSRDELSFLNDEYTAFLTQAETINAGGKFRIQAQVKYNGTPTVIKTSKEIVLTVDPSTFKEEW